MLFETSEQFEQSLTTYTSRIDPTGELAELVIEYLYFEKPIEKFLGWLKTNGAKIPYTNGFVNPRFGNLPVDLVGENAYKYFSGAPEGALKSASTIESAENLLYEVSYYLAIVSVIDFAEKKRIVKSGFGERFMRMNKLFYSESGLPGDRAQFGYIATRLEFPSCIDYFQREATKLFKTLEDLVPHGVYLVHGDCKLDNILVNKEGKICLIDFGLATIHIRFGDGTALGNGRKQKAPDLMFADPLLFAITYNNRQAFPAGEGPLPPGEDYFDILGYYDDQTEFIDDMYEVTYNFFYHYHRKKPFNLETHFCEYLKLKKS